MKPAALRLAVTVVLFAGWVGYLGYLAATTRNKVVLSRPQFLVASLVVVAHGVGDDSFAVDDVLFPATPDGQAEKGRTVVVRNLKECQTWSADGWRAVPPAEGLPVLLALLNPPPTAGAAADDAPQKNDVAPIPLSPGYAPAGGRTGAGPPRIYPADAAVLREYRALPKPQ